MTSLWSCFYKTVQWCRRVQNRDASTEHQVCYVSMFEIVEWDVIYKFCSETIWQRANSTRFSCLSPIVVPWIVIPVDETLRHHNIVDASDIDASARTSVTKCGWFILVVVVISRATRSGCRGAHLIYIEKKDQDSRSFATWTPTIETTFVMTESAVQRNPRHMGELHVNIEIQTPAHCV